MVNMIDEFNIAGVSRFSLAPFEDRDKALIEKVKK
jgi:hypothetical protein